MFFIIQDAHPIEETSVSNIKVFGIINHAIKLSLVSMALSYRSRGILYKLKHVSLNE